MNRTSLALFATAVLWGGTFIAGRLLASEINPLPAAFLRFVAASAFLGVLLLRREGPPPRLSGRTLLLLAGLGATGVLGYNAFFFLGLKTVPAGRASLIVAANPVVIALLARLFFKEFLGPSKIAAVVLCLAGAAVVITRGQPDRLLSGTVGMGELALMGCVISWALYSILGKLVMGTLTPLAAVTLSCLAGTAMLAVPALADGLTDQAANLSLAGWAAILYLGFLGTGLAFLWFYQGIQAVGASRAAVYINFVPVSAAAMGALFLGESLDLSVLAGGALVLCGVALANRPARTRRA